MLKSVIVAICLCATIARAHSAELSGDQIKDLLAGATVEIDTPAGTRLPVRYGRDGKLAGRAGGLAWYLGAAVDRGRWWVASDRLCHKWQRWFNSVPQCIRLSAVGRTIRWRSRDGYSGTARISVPPPVRTAAVPARPPAAKPAAPTKAPAAAAGAADPGNRLRTARPSAEPAAGADRPSRLSRKRAAVAPRAQRRPAPAPIQVPEQAPEQAKSPSPPKGAQRTARPMFRVVNVRSDDVLNVRSGPSADFDIVGELPPGSRGIAIISACRSQWCPVQHRATRGWVHSAYLASEEAASTRAPVRASAWLSPPVGRAD